MKKELFKVIEMNKFEYGIIINALNDLRNKLTKEGQDPIVIEELLLKIFKAPEQKRYYKKEDYIDSR